MKKTIMKIFLILMISVIAGSFMPVRNAEAASPKLSTTKKTLYTGENFTLTLKNAKKTVKWKSSNEKVAKVNSSGKVTAIGSGTAKITAKYKSATYTCKVTVKAPHINCKSAELYVDGTLQLEMFGADVVKYESSNESVAKVNNKGLITAIDFGKAAIAVSCSDGKTYKCSISVESTNENSVALNDLSYFYMDGKVFSNSGYWTRSYPYYSDNDYMEDNLGNFHKDVFQNYGYVIYKIDKEYSYASGTLYLIYRDRSTTADNIVTIYGDDVKLWEGNVTAGVEPIDFKVSVKGVDKLKIEGNYTSAAIGEFLLIP
ncbi:MAG: Ig-like domain-containing protein [Lachnospiraceae bacterium]|nr:Ig-like domain-containing protein [Lachnospiraceae bacterium]